MWTRIRKMRNITEEAGDVYRLSTISIRICFPVVPRSNVRRGGRYLVGRVCDCKLKNASGATFPEARP